MIAAGLLNFVWFLTNSASLGGDALNGYVCDGRYFVASHGSYTEVAASEWIVNRNIGVLTLITWPLVMLAGAFLLFRYAFPYAMSGRFTRRPNQARVAQIRESSSLIASSDSGGSIGDVHMSAGMLGADVYHAGLVVRPRFMPTAAIPIDEISSVRHSRGLLGRRLEIEHDGFEIASPLVLFVDEDSDAARAIDSITAARPSGAGTVTRPADSSPGSATDASVGKPGPPRVLRALSAMGLVVSVGLIVAGVAWAIPTLGVFAVVWTAFAIGILAVNMVRFVRRGY
ncbi:MAG TPA: hypothetical protein VGQ89_13910 [Candidatus Limnocylindrales bacterium]|jgi:hypothetical protein|nr:hypothetical protein [Candidatus Limnocylindrales bacterium]